jgi:hypothetical protein
MMSEGLKYLIETKNNCRIVYELLLREVVLCVVLLVKLPAISRTYEEVHSRFGGMLTIVLGYCVNDEGVFSG